MSEPVPVPPPAWLHAFAWATRQFHPKGIDRLVRMIHPPGNANPVRTVVDYDDGLVLNIDTASFCEWYIWFYGAFRPEISKLLNRMLQSGHVAIDIDPELIPGARNAVRVCLQLKPEERITIITDEATRDIAAALQAEVGAIG